MSADRGSRRLGRGLDALLGERRPGTSPTDTGQEGDGASQAEPGKQLGSDSSDTRDTRDTRDTLVQLDVADIRANPYQPRTDFSSKELSELRESIAQTGLLQPVTVRKVPNEAGYELVAGERRLRAVKELGWSTIPAIVREYDDQATLALALVENLQREDLNPVEEAEGYARLSADFGLTQAELAELVGKDRSTIANLLRVLQLPAAVRQMLQGGELTLGHARPLLALNDERLVIRLAREAVEHGLSVRAVEEKVRRDAPRSPKPQRGRPRKADPRPAAERFVEDNLRRVLQTDVALRTRKDSKGEIRIQFYSAEDLDRILDLLGATE